MEKINAKGMATVAIHGTGGHYAEHAHLTPIFATSTFTFDTAEQGMARFSGSEPGYTYSRFGNPTVAAAEEMVAALETLGVHDASGQPLAARALLHASGQSAMVTMFLSNLRAGDSVLATRSLYGGTYEFLDHLLPSFGIRPIFDSMHDLDALDNLLKREPSVRMLHFETPANPTMDCIDMEGVCAVAKKHGRLVTVDNTLATPYLQQPFRYGVDFIFHSTTKFLNGHGSAIGGILLGRDVAFMNTAVHRTYKLLGACSSPFDAFLLTQGIKTLALRMEKHCANADRVSRFLSEHRAVSLVNYNGLPQHPGYAISLKQMHLPGAVMSVELRDGFEQARKFINALRLCTRAVSLGTTDTLISHPASMSHAGMSPEERRASGIGDGLIRMSIGLEDIDDILADLEQALR